MLYFGLFVGLVASTLFFHSLLTPIDKTKNELVRFKIKRGENFSIIAERLLKESLVKSSTAFKIYAMFTLKATKMQPGIYNLRSQMSIPEIVSSLTSGVGSEAVVVIKEGYTVEDIESALVAAEVIEKETIQKTKNDLKQKGRWDFLKQADDVEGFLFPDTYRFHIDSDPTEVVVKMLDSFEEKAWPLLREKKNWYEVLIIASLLEREVKTFEDRQLVAGIIEKRQKLGMPLQIDATISYAKCGQRITECSNGVVTEKDLSIQSKYNTYQYSGLPPTPIGNPGLDAIKAAMKPKVSPYLYYLSAKGTGTTLFSRTLEEHNEKRAKYL